MLLLARVTHASLLIFSFLPVACAQIPAAKFEAILREYVAFGPEDSVDVEAGKIVVKLLPTNEKREIAVFGIARLEENPQPSMLRFRESLRPKNTETVLMSEKFSTPPSIEDLKSLTLERSDLEDLRSCRIGDCKVRVSTQLIEVLKEDPDWTSPDLQDRVTALFREDVLNFVVDYLHRGDEALARYGHAKHGVGLAEEHRYLLDKSPLIAFVSAELADYLRKFPGNKFLEVESTLRWSKVSFGLKPIVVVTHTVAHERREGTTPQFLIVTKQIYASRYIDASLALSLLVTVGSGERRREYLIFTDISRSRSLTGLFSGFKRSVAGEESILRVTDVLRHAKASLRVIPDDERNLDTITKPEGKFGQLLQYWEDQRTLVILVVSVIFLLLVIYKLFRS